MAFCQTNSFLKFLIDFYFEQKFRTNMNLTKVPVNAKTTTHIYITCSLSRAVARLRLAA
jgi:hypothetical protein